MTSDMVVTLNKAFHLPEMRKNLVSADLLIKNGFKCVLVSNKVVISKNEMHVGKGYLFEGFFKLNIMVAENNSTQASSYLIESNDLWLLWFRHVNYKTLCNMNNLNLLPKFDNKTV